MPKFVLTYSLATRTVRVYGAAEGEMRIPPGETFFSLLDGAQTALAPVSGGAGGFRGGWTGWFTYEMKAESLAGYNLPIGKRGPERLDAVWAWVDLLTERAEDGQWTARGVVSEGGRPSSPLLDWLTSLGITFGVKQADFDAYASRLREVLSSPPQQTSEPASGFPRFRPRVSGEEHMARIDKCRDAISEGESYELNQTTSFLATLKDDPYPTYLRLRTFNPAYYSAFIHFPTLPTPKGRGLAVISSSPERFLQITEGEIEMRPIKGTARRVQPGQCVCVDGRGCDGKEPGSEACAAEGRRVDEQRGKELSEDLKERAENLMVSQVKLLFLYQLTPDRRPDPLRPALVLCPVDRDCAAADRSRVVRRAQPRDDSARPPRAAYRPRRSHEALLPAGLDDGRAEAAHRAAARRLRGRLSARHLQRRARLLLALRKQRPQRRHPHHGAGGRG